MYFPPPSFVYVRGFVDKGKIHPSITVSPFYGYGIPPGKSLDGDSDSPYPRTNIKDSRSTLYNRKGQPVKKCNRTSKMSYQKGRRTMAPKKKEKNLNQIAKHFNSGGSQSRAIENEIHQCITDLFLLRKEVLKLAGGMDGLNCDPMSFDKECELTNAHFHKNRKREDIKSHHYIISYDPADVTENGLTGVRAQTISLELAKQMFPGYQTLVVTHTDGHNESRNIHTHIVINSVRKTAVERQPYMDKPHEEAAGYKHRSTDKFMNTFKKTIMDRCQQEGLHQIDLLAPAEKKITQKEYMAQKHGQQKLDEINQKIIEDGLKPTSTVFRTQKEYLRNAIDECAVTSISFDEFQSKLLEQFQISVIEHRGRYSYLHPDRQKRITERALGTRYGKAHLEQTFLRKSISLSKLHQKFLQIGKDTLFKVTLCKICIL